MPIYRQHKNPNKNRKIQLCSCGCGQSLGNLNSYGTHIRIKVGKEIFLEGHEKRGFKGYDKYIENKKKEKLSRQINGKVWPGIHEIIEYNKDWIIEGKFKVTIENAHDHCWACGRKLPLERAHVIARRHTNGNNHPQNFWLLCGGCHRIQPDSDTIENQLEWVKRMPAIDNSFDYAKAVTIDLSLRWGLPIDHPCIVEIIFLWTKLQLDNDLIDRTRKDLLGYKDEKKRLEFLENRKSPITRFKRTN